MLELSEFLEKLGDGSVGYNADNPSMAYRIPALGIQRAGGEGEVEKGEINLVISFATAELATIGMAVNRLLVLPDKTPSAILTDPRSVF